MLLRTVATVQNLKKDKVAQQNGTIDVQFKNTGCTVQKHCTCIHAFIYKKNNSKLFEIETDSSLVSFNAWNGDFFFFFFGVRW